MGIHEKQTLNLVLRTRAAAAVVILCFLALALRLWHLQIVNGLYYRDQSENNRLRQLFIPAPRGLIHDRDGRILVRNRPSFNIELVVEDSPDPRATLWRLAEIVDEKPEELVSRLKGTAKRRAFEPRLILRDIDRDLLARVAVHRYELPGVIVNVVPAREYVYGDLAAHVLGYIREITKEQLEGGGYPGYRQGDLIGQYGIEARWEELLNGQRGIQYVVVNATGTRISEEKFEPERSGNNLTLTIDLDVQKAADGVLADKAGAIVAIVPSSGEILALSSSPRFDPNVFVSEMTAEVWNDLRSGPGRKLTNRAVQGEFHPGSVFKPFMSVAALSEKVVNLKESVNCPGWFQVGSRRFRCHKRAGHGIVDHFSAMVKSCDVFFYTVGQRLGVDRIHDYATRFGLGAPTGLNLAREAGGLIPSTEWKRKYFRNPENQKWYPGETPSVAIGQGAVTTTPLQLAVSTSALVNGGLVMRPTLVRKIQGADGGFIDTDFEPEIVRAVDVDKSILEIVKRDMVGVVNDPGGTGRRAKLPEQLGVTVGGKTGTAQVVSLDAGARGQEFQDHAWFVGFAPAEQPEILVVALVENGGSGGAVAAPLVRQVLEAYFYKKREMPAPALEAVPIPVQAGGHRD